jgi:hypothetical protein
MTSLNKSKSKIGKGIPIQSQTKEVIMKLKEYFERKNKENGIYCNKSSIVSD